MVFEILTYPNPVLRKKSVKIKKITEEVRILAEDMAETMYASEGVGLAAPQIGKLVRMITVDISGPEKREQLMTLINPEIIQSEGICESKEGCLSVLNLRENVERAERITVRALNLEGKEILIKAEELLAICLQHEIDHLDGVLFLDHLSRLKRALYERKLKKCLKKK